MFGRVFFRIDSAAGPRAMRLRCALTMSLIGSLGACSEVTLEQGESGPLGYCGEHTAALVSGTGTPAEPLAPLFETAIVESSCGAIEREYATTLAPTHVMNCSELDHVTNPPCVGSHYGTWAAFKVYDVAIPRGFWVHSLEHGAVVIAYSCDDCDDEVDAAKALMQELPVDPLCSAPVERRVVLTPDPKLDTRWAAAAWGFTLTSDCFEPEVFRAFATAHYAGGPEDFCADGLDVGPTAD